LPIAIEGLLPTDAVESTVVRVFPEEHAALPHFATFRVPLPVSPYAMTGKLSLPIAIEVPTPARRSTESTVVMVFPDEHAALPHFTTFKSELVA
jgi:hypothetical protein